MGDAGTSAGGDVLVLLAHPDLRRSRVSQRLAERLGMAEGVRLRDLYALYPDYWIDVAQERAALVGARLIVWLQPWHWYGATPLLRLWMDEVLGFGWAFGPGGRALAGKDLLLVTSTGGGPEGYAALGGFEQFLPPYRHCASLCGLRFLEPAVLHDAHRLSAADIEAFADGLLARLRRHPEGEEGLWPLPPPVAREERPENDRHA
ncbi:NAD(P)H-dependent oxidoreductase [Inhella sp.]|uniref:NAD(P)H-dependent oxidoreductase n=1 Tax=Inhella sp. TaxID=1921806 RepID=UPI0035B01865